MIAAHLPILQVAVPLLGAPLCTLSRSSRVAWALALALCGWAFLASLALLLRALNEGPFSYALGSWAAPWGIEYRVDVLSSSVALLVSALAAVVTLYARDSVEQELDGDRIPLFYTAYLLCLAGLLGITLTGDVFNLFVFLEISSLSTYTLIALGRDRRALTAAYQYLIMGTVGATFVLIGVGLMYLTTGTLNMADLAARLPLAEPNRTVRVAFAFLTVGICLKLALFPLHLWLPDAYTFAPSAVTALLASTATKVAVYMLLRFFYTVFGPSFSFHEMALGWVLLPFALVAIFSMSLVAIFQGQVKRMLAYSSVAQIGYIILGVAMGTATGLTASLLHLFNHALMKGTLFLALGCVAYRVGSTRLEAMAGLARQMPWTMAAFVVGGLSLIGVPLTAGFVSKWYLLLAAIERGWWPVAVLVIAASLMALVYIWRVVEAAYLQSPSAATARVVEAPATLLIPTWLLATANLYFGIDGTRTAAIAGEAAASLLGVVP